MPNDDEASMDAALECAAHTHVGRVRNRNEDSLWVDRERGWLLLADGMGGHSAGDVASTLAISHALDHLRKASPTEYATVEGRARLLVKSIDNANTAIRQAANGDLMGSTFVGALLASGEMVYAHIGDSRLYLLRAGVLTQLTQDHTLVQEYVSSGQITPEMAQNHPYRGLLTRGLGIEEDVEAVTGTCVLSPGDRVLLCSDGLTDMVDEDEIAALLGALLTPTEIAVSLVDAANTHGGRDNISVIVAWFSA
ncbi:MAG: protein phosphatase 2C domain-containing protein [Azoarcus sp.]|nr:protein phosphatase 2C domain-containing protein [Azoarcus sp.]